MSSSTTTALSRQPLAQVLRNLTYPRDRRGVRHDLPTVLSLAVTGVLAGCRSLTAIWEHATDLTAADLEALGLQVGQALPSESTIRRVLQDLDPTNLDTHVRSWLCTRSGTIEGRTVIAVDGKTMRAARTGKDPAPHLLAALDQATGTVLAQARVADKSNEIPALRELLKPPRPGRGGGERRRDAHPNRYRQVDPPSRTVTTCSRLWAVRRPCAGHSRSCPDKDVPSTSWGDVSHGRRVRRTARGDLGSHLGGLPRSGSSGPGPAHPNHQGSQEHRQERRR